MSDAIPTLQADIISSNAEGKLEAEPRILDDCRASGQLTRKRIIVFLSITFIATWGFWFAVVYPLSFAGKNMQTSAIVQLAVGAGMFFPALSVALTRLITREGFKGSSWILPRNFRRTWPYYLLGWFGPILLIFAGTGLYFLLNPSAFDPSLGFYVQMIEEQLAATGQSELMDASIIRATGYLQIGIVFVSPLLNCVTCFGEEWGWRGYLLPKLLERHGIVKTLLIAGLIWGVWHAPITILGHNYGMGYLGWPLTGIAAMCAFTTVIGVLFSYLTLRAGSCLPAVFAHGALNGTVGVGQLFLVANAGNPFIGPACTGIIGGAFFIIVGALCTWRLVQREKNSQNQGPIL